MTATLGQAYGEPVALDVLAHAREGDCYRRKIVLTVDRGSRVVEFGIVRLDLAATGNGVRDRILARDAPLGDILNRHRVLTQVAPLWYLRFANDAPLGQYFRPPPATPLYGRLGMIYCDGKPAVELLEVVRIDVPQRA
jgi:chorismate-pyruvate lyase